MGAALGYDNFLDGSMASGTGESIPAENLQHVLVTPTTAAHTIIITSIRTKACARIVDATFQHGFDGLMQS